MGKGVGERGGREGTRVVDDFFLTFVFFSGLFLWNI